MSPVSLVTVLNAWIVTNVLNSRSQLLQILTILPTVRTIATRMLLVLMLLVIITVPVTTVTLVMASNALISTNVTMKLTMIVTPTLNVLILLVRITVPALTDGLVLDSMAIVLISTSALTRLTTTVTASMVSVSTKMVNIDADVMMVSSKVTMMELNVLTGMNVLARTAAIIVMLMLNVQIHLVHIIVLVVTFSLAMVSVMMVVAIKMNVGMPLVHQSIKGLMKHFSLLTNVTKTQLVPIRTVVTIVPVTLALSMKMMTVKYVEMLMNVPEKVMGMIVTPMLNVSTLVVLSIAHVPKVSSVMVSNVRTVMNVHSIQLKLKLTSLIQIMIAIFVLNTLCVITPQATTHVNVKMVMLAMVLFATISTNVLMKVTITVIQKMVSVSTNQENSDVDVMMDSKKETTTELSVTTSMNAMTPTPVTLMLIVQIYQVHLTAHVLMDTLVMGSMTAVISTNVMVTILSVT